jgi:hypothetical protein
MQVSRLGNPLFNEVTVPMSERDQWNQTPPSDDKVFAKYVAHPELSNLLPVLYPAAFPNLAALNAAKKSRADLIAILLTGIPSGTRTQNRHQPQRYARPAHPRRSPRTDPRGPLGLLHRLREPGRGRLHDLGRCRHAGRIRAHRRRRGHRSRLV